MQSEIDRLQARLAELHQQEVDIRKMRQEAKTVENRLAYLHGSAFVTVETEHEVEVYGASNGYASRGKGLRIVSCEGNYVSISHPFVEGRFEIHVAVDGRAAFYVEDRTEERRTFYIINVFGFAEEAEVYAERRRTELTSR